MALCLTAVSVHRDVLPFPLQLPEVIARATSHRQLEAISHMGQGRARGRAAQLHPPVLLGEVFLHDGHHRGFRVGRCYTASQCGTGYGGFNFIFIHLHYNSLARVGRLERQDKVSYSFLCIADPLEKYPSPAFRPLQSHSHHVH